MYKRTIIRDLSKPPSKYKTVGIAVTDIISTSPLRLDRIFWYTSGFK
jgi:hypothetical protein